MLAAHVPMGAGSGSGGGVYAKVRVCSISTLLTRALSLAGDVTRKRTVLAPLCTDPTGKSACWAWFTQPPSFGVESQGTACDVVS